MGQSTNAILFYGYCWEEETSKPWEIGREEDEDDEGDEDDDDEDGDDDDEDDEDVDDDECDDEDDWEKRYCALKGLREPEEAYPEKGIDPKTGRYNDNYNAEEQKIVAAYKKCWEQQRKMLAGEPCEVATHCSCDYPMPYVAIKKSKTVSYRGSMNEIKSLDVNPEWDLQLKEFCKVMGIKVGNKKPKWWLVSLWC